MSDDRREADFTRVVSAMEDAVRLLEPPLSQDVRFALSHFREHVRARALERAWDALTEAGEAAQAPRRFWARMADAATMLGLEERRTEAVRRGAQR